MSPQAPTPTAPPCLCAAPFSLRSADREGNETYVCRSCGTIALRNLAGWLWARADGSVLRWRRGASEFERLSGPVSQLQPAN